MFRLRSCSCRCPPTALSHSPRRRLNLLSLSPKPFSLKFLSSSSNPNPLTITKMSSSRPSAFDAMMSNARAAAAKKKQPQPKKSSSPPSQKRKTLDPSNGTLIPNLKSANADVTSNSSPVEEIKPANRPQSDKPKPSLIEESPVVKKTRVITVDDSIAELRKKAVSFDPKGAAFWGERERVPFLFLVRVFDAIDKESGRIIITEIVCNMLRTVIQTTPDDFVAVVYLLANRIAPAHEGLELGIGDATIIKALAEACGGKETHIKKQYGVNLYSCCT